MVYTQFGKCVLNSLFVANQCRTQCLLTDKCDDISDDILIGHFVPSRVQLLLREVMAIKLQFKALKGLSSKLRWSGAHGAQCCDGIHVSVNEVLECFQIILGLLTFAITTRMINELIFMVVNHNRAFPVSLILIKNSKGFPMAKQR